MLSSSCWSVNSNSSVCRKVDLHTGCRLLLDMSTVEVSDRQMTCGAAEDGLITYIRTDSPTLDETSAKEIREAVEAIYGLDFLSDEANLYKYALLDNQGSLMLCLTLDFNRTVEGGASGVPASFSLGLQDRLFSHELRLNHA